MSVRCLSVTYCVSLCLKLPPERNFVTFTRAKVKSRSRKHKFNEETFFIHIQKSNFGYWAIQKLKNWWSVVLAWYVVQKCGCGLWSTRSGLKLELNAMMNAADQAHYQPDHKHHQLALHEHPVFQVKKENREPHHNNQFHHNQVQHGPHNHHHPAITSAVEGGHYLHFRIKTNLRVVQLN